MDIIRYAAVIDRSNNTYGVTFPDLLGCTSGGDDLAHAITNAGEALALHTSGMLEDGEKLSTPTPRNKVEIEPELNVCAIALIEARQPSRKVKVRINVIMEAKLLEEIDAVAPNRSLFLSKAARGALMAG
jgi:predicted RNase H-like HicB family nuclease